MSVTKQMLEDHAKLIEQKLGIAVKTDTAKAGSWFSTMATSENTKVEAFVKSHPGVVAVTFVAMLFGFALGFLVGKI